VTSNVAREYCWKGYVRPNRPQISAAILRQKLKTPAVPASAKVYVCPPCDQDCDTLTFDKPGTCPHCGMTLIEKPNPKASKQ
jgi:DNA-directed RNA polymerase subunit RPC12/RpoP